MHAPTRPTLNVPAGSNLGCNPANPPTDVTVAAQVTASDTCSTVSTNVSHLDSTNGCVITRTFTVIATDACTNATSKNVVYFWTADTTGPAIFCATNRTVSLGSPWAFDPPSAPADSCGTNRIVVLNTTTNPICGNSFSATRMWAAIDTCNNSNTCSQTITVQDTNVPLLGITKNCNPQIIENGQTVIFTGVVTNLGATALTSITVTDPLLNSVIATVPYLAPGDGAPFSASYTNSEILCVSRTITNIVTASAANFCNPSQLATAMNSCTFTIPCPNICITKELACFIGTNAQGSEICDTFHKLATGVQGDTQDPAFCYHITITNCGQADLTNVTVVDDKFGDLTTNAFSNSKPMLAAGANVSFEYKAELGGASLPSTSALVTNTVVASGQSVISGHT